MAVSQPGYFNVQAFTNAGDLGDGLRLYTYTPATTTHKVAYTDPAGAIPHTYTNDGSGGLYIALDARGELPAPLFLSTGGYDLALKTAAGASIWTRRTYGQDDAAASLRSDIASTSDAAKGAGMVGFSPTLNYAVGTLGYSEKATVHLRQFSDFVGDGVADDTAAVQAALNFMSATRGKGILEAEGCRIRLTSKLTIPSWVLFRGASWLPDPSNGAQVHHTCLYIDWGDGADNHAVEMSHSSGIEGFTFYYPDQVAKTAATPTAFGYAISTPTAAGTYDNIHVKNITLYNAYKGIRLNNGGRWRVENIQGDPLFMGFTADNCLDVCYMSGVHFWNFYTQSNTLETWVAANATAFEFRRIDQLWGSKLFSWNRNIGFHCRDNLWANLTDIAVDKANSPFITELSTQVQVNGFVFIGNANVKPAIWGRSIGESARFSNGRITTAGSVGAQIDDGTQYTFDNVNFDCPHSCVVNLSSTTEVRISDTCTWAIPPFGMYNTWVNGEPLPKADTAITLGSATTAAGASAIAGGFRLPLDAVASPSVYWDMTLIGQRCSLYILEFDYTPSATFSSTWYFHFLVAKDIGTDVNTSYAPLAPLILNAGSVTRKIRIPFHINHARNLTVLRLRAQVTSAVPGAYLDVTNIVLYEQASRYMTDAQIGNMFRIGACLDPLGKGQTVSAKGKARTIITEPEAGVGRAGATPSAGIWAVGDQVLLDAPTAGASPGVVCTTAGDFAGVAPVFKALPNLAA
jgi:hypothetical protein